MFEDDNEEDIHGKEDADQAGSGLNSYLNKIDMHLEVEKKILEAWNYKDKIQTKKEN